jgi:hypothetical protein
VSIKIINRAGSSAPIFVCDVCGDGINILHEGAVVFDMLVADNVKTDAVHVHKGDCLDIAEKRIGVERAGWDELGEHLKHLIANCPAAK